MSFGRPYILNIDGCIHDGWVVIDEYNQANTIRPGMPLSGTTGSVGYRARRNGRDGFVTAAHVVDRGQGQIIPSVGFVAAWQWGGNIDAAFIETNPAVTPVNTLAVTGATLDNRLPVAYRVGDRIAKIGRATDWTEGAITNTSGSFTYRGVTLIQQALTNAPAAQGDSGGIVIWLSVQGAHGAFVTGRTAGIAVGLADRNDPRTMVFSRADHINARFGLTLY